MLNQIDLNTCRNADISACDISSLVDLRDIFIDPVNSLNERVESFLNQIHNPYLFKVEDIIVKVNYGNEKNISDALATVLLME